MIPKGADIRREENTNGGKYSLSDKEVEWVKQQIKANGGCFSLPIKQAKELFNYSGGGKNGTVIANMASYIRRKKHPFKLGVRDKKNRVVFKKL